MARKISEEQQRTIRDRVDRAILDGDIRVLPGEDIPKSIGQRAAETQAIAREKDAEEREALRAKELKTITIRVRVSPGFHRALQTYVGILRREGHAVTVSSVIRQIAHGRMSRRLRLMLGALGKATGEEKKRLQVEARALGGYIMGEGR